MTIIKHILCFFCLLSLPTALYAQNLSSTELAHYAKDYLKNYGVSEHATAIAISVWNPSQGSPLSTFATTSSQKIMTPPHLFQIGSLTKSFIAALILKLESNPAYHFSIDDPIDKFFPEYKNWHAITIRNLLNMTSGIPDYFSDKAVLASYAKHPFVHYSPNYWLNLVYKKPLLFKPGQHFHYSNSNYFLLGRLIEHLTGQSLNQALKEKMLVPLGLKHTFYVAHILPSTLQPYLVHGYQYEKIFANNIPPNTDVSHYSLSYLGAAGSMVTDAKDVATWIHALFTPGKILPRRSLGEMLELISEKTGHPVAKLNENDRYGYGLGISVQYEPTLNTDVYIYQGVTFGYRAMYIYLPKKKIVAAVLVNSCALKKPNHLYELLKKILTNTTLNKK